MTSRSLICFSIAFWLVTSAQVAHSQENLEPTSRQIVRSIHRSIVLIETASAGTAKQRQCFTCHGQAMPVVALTIAGERGFPVDEANVSRQVDHTHAFLKRSQPRYDSGKGTGGQVDTAGWAMWTLEAAKREPDAYSDSVIKYLIGRQKAKGQWKCTSDRPPSESSDFATSYLALRALDHFARDSHLEQAEQARSKAKDWFLANDPDDTEDHVFRLLSLPYVDMDDQIDPAVEQLKAQQREDGGWAQLAEASSDAYATATALYALAENGVAADESCYRRGVRYLLDNQLDDGSWHVVTRSDPFQEYFESGFPHEDDQFISTTATCWAVVALSHAVPDNAVPDNAFLIEGNKTEEPTSD